MNLLKSCEERAEEPHRIVLSGIQGQPGHVGDIGSRRKLAEQRRFAIARRCGHKGDVALLDVGPQVFQ